jgi:hypothetical protein
VSAEPDCALLARTGVNSPENNVHGVSLKFMVNDQQTISIISES